MTLPAPTARRGRGATWEWLTLGVCVLVGLVCAVAAGVGAKAFTDLRVYRWGGSAVIEGMDLYGDGRPEITLPFTYPPFAAMLMTVLAVLPFVVVVGLWTAASMWALGRSSVLLFGEWSRQVPPYAVPLAVTLSLALQPVLSNLLYAQINLFLLWAILVDFLGRQGRWSGVLLGVVAGIKLTPLIFIVLLVLIGRRRAARNAVLGFAGTVGVGFVVMPGTATAYWTDVLWDPARVGGVGYAGNQSVNGVLTRVLGAEPSTLLWFAIAGALAFATVVLAAVLWRRGHRDLGVGLGGVAMLLASPISWGHHWVWAIPVGVALWRIGLRGSATAWAALFFSHCIVWPPDSQGREFGWAGWEVAAGNAYVIGAVLLVLRLGILVAPTDRDRLTRIRLRPRLGRGDGHSPDRLTAPAQHPQLGLRRSS